MQKETRPRDVPPVKQTPPGVCNYCERKGHLRSQCRSLAVREREPYSVWCNRCLMKNHKEAHCTYQVKINSYKSSLKYTKHFQPFHKYTNSYQATSGALYNKVRVFSNSKYHTSNYQLNKELYARLNKLPSELRS
ncbi:unnamed protein product [Rotaria socialis]|uniref:Uncharacterized protein n=1 Tax=Rotaria socialis TaxID=392032 RepID=A0A821N947_9BILA|nr:unnamed protein product [Rotaria socialis]